MKAEEIRELWHNFRGPGSDHCAVRLLAEIAAQLAEANELSRGKLRLLAEIECQMREAKELGKERDRKMHDALEQQRKLSERFAEGLDSPPIVFVPAGGPEA